jgi:hypothetical protein
MSNKAKISYHHQKSSSSECGLLLECCLLVRSTSDAELVSEY